jgi:glyoxylate/hydroxypyruvate reductase
VSLLLLTDLTDDEDGVWLDALRSALPAETLVAHGRDTYELDGIDVALVANPPFGVLRTLPSLQMIQSLWAGVDGLLKDPTLPAHIPIVRMIDPSMADAMAQAALAHVLSAHLHHDDYARDQRRGVWRPVGPTRTGNQSVGVLGLGNIGRNVAQRLASAGFHTIGWAKSKVPLIEGVKVFTGRDELSKVLERSDILVNLLPLTPDTHSILGSENLGRLPVGSVIINFGRGAHVVEDDLVALLDSAHIRHAVLDVFETEPLPSSCQLWNHLRVTITPHVAGPSDPKNCAAVVADNLRRWRRGERLQNTVDQVRGY